MDISSMPRSYDRLMGCIENVRFSWTSSSNPAPAMPIQGTTSPPGTTVGAAATTVGAAATNPSASNTATANATSPNTPPPSSGDATSENPTASGTNETSGSLPTEAAATGTEISGSTAGSGVEATPTEAGNEVPIGYRVRVEDGCINGCDTANPCEHGECINHYSTMSCNCFMSGYEGERCDHEGSTPVTLGGYQYLTYTLFLGDQDTYSAEDLISMKFKINPSHQSAVLYYAVGALPSQTYLAVFIQDGQLSVNIKYSSEDIMEFLELGVVNDNVWHSVSVTQHGTTVSVIFDNATMSHTITGSNTVFTFDPLSYIGGGEGLNGYPGLPVSTKFVGCLKEVYINHFDVTSALHGQSSTRVFFMGGAPSFECRDIDIIPVTFPTPESYIHLEGWHNADLSLRFSFRTANGSALMMTAHTFMNTTHRGRLTLDLEDGVLMLKLATDPHVPLSLDYVTSIGARLHDGLWHDVNLTVTAGQAMLELDGESASFTFTEVLSPRGTVFLGGWNGKGFEGCMQNIYMQEKMLVPTEVDGTLIMRGVTLDGCPLAGNPCVAGEVVCANGGTCVEQDGRPVCLCTDPKFTGVRCQFYTYKSSCAEYFYSGDTTSGAKLIDIDGAGPFEPFYIECDFSRGTTAFEIPHNLQPETLVRHADLPHLEFDLEYMFMTNAMLHLLIGRSKGCSQHFDYHCFEAPLRLGRDTTLTTVAGKEVPRHAMPFLGNCDKGRRKWMRDEGNITSMFYLPITKLSLRPFSDPDADFTKGTLTLGPLRCEHSLGYTVPYTVSLLNQEQHLAMDGWRTGMFSFSFRTHDLNSVLFHQRATWRTHNFLMASITGTNTLKFELHMNDDIQMHTISTERMLTDGQWHTLTLQKTTHEIHVTIDFDRYSLTLPVGQEMGIFGGQMHIGGSGVLPSGFLGMSGCISGVLINGKYQFIYDFYNEFTNPNMKPGCSSACDKQPCQNGGECMDEWGSFTCKCTHPSLLGQTCAVDKRQDTLTFKMDSAFVNFDPKNNEVLTSNFHLGFRTFQTDALLFYAYDQVGNFVQLDIEAGDSLVMKFNKGKEVVQLVSRMNASALNDGSWIDVSVLRDEKSVKVVLDEQFSSTFDGNATLLTENDGTPFTGVQATVRPLLPFSGPSESFVKIYVGGVPEGTTAVPTLQGCIRGLVINGEGFNLQEKAQNEEGISTTCTDNCLPSNPCMNGGTCMEKFETFECNCTTTSYTGRTCTEDVGATFKNTTVLLYPLISSPDEPADVLEVDDLHFGFSTTSPDGTIFYARNNFAESAQQNYISVSLQGGHLKFVFNFGTELVEIEKTGPYNDGYRHGVVVKRFGRRILVDVDNQGEDYTTHLSQARHFDGRAAIVVGGVENNMGMFTSGGYEGCITSLYYNNKTPLDLDINGLGMKRAECAAFKSVSTTSTMTTEMPSNPLLNKPMTMPPWNVARAKGQEVESDGPEDTSRDVLLMGIIIAVFVVAFLILIVCIIVTVISIKNSNNQQAAAAAAEKDGEPKEMDGLLEEGRGGSSGRSGKGGNPPPGKRPLSAEISIKELEWDPQIEKNIRQPELEWDNTSYSSPDTPLEDTPLAGTPDELFETPLESPSTPATPQSQPNNPSPTLLQLAANHSPHLYNTSFLDYSTNNTDLANLSHIRDTPV
ncbi:axotactin-like isoform X1 [Lytechinus pictus]|uniref:axotactin-like isoform X1 n=1 Tax=Lytechinus pictus TaxID=7653 RepID=UPI0030BA0DCF